MAGITMETVMNIITKHRTLRTDGDMEMLVPWLRKRSALLQNLDKSTLTDIGRNCTYFRAIRDDIIIQQGEKGDAFFDDVDEEWDNADLELSFYIILSGHVSVYIDPRMTGEEEGLNLDRSGGSGTKRKEEPKKPATPPANAQTKGLEPLAEEEEEEEEGEEGSDFSKEKKDDVTDAPQKKAKKLTMLDRTKFGKYIVSYDAGKAFGEVALVKRDSFRNASIIADEDVDLLVIGQDLFNRSLKADQEKEFAEINKFIESHPYFNTMPNRLKKLLEMSLRRKTYIFESVIVKQGEPVTGLQFILRGQANVTIEPHKHPKQYKHLWPFEAGVDIYSIEFEHLREARRQAILRQYEDPSVWETYPEEVTLRIEEGYPAIEKRMKEKHALLCSIGKNEVIGDVEMLMNLDTTVHTITCTANTDVFILDTKNFERIVGKKNAATLEIMKEHLKNKLNTWMDLKQGQQVPFLKFLYQKLTEESLPQSKPLPPLKSSKGLPDKETQRQQLLHWFKEGKSTVVEPVTPGAVFYKELMKQKAAAREVLRQTTETNTKPTINATIRNAKRQRALRKPRSLMEIREKLQQMMEAEIIQIEQEELKKQLGSKTRKKEAVPVQRSKRKRRHSKAKSDIEGTRSKSDSMNSLHSLPNFYSNKPPDNSESFLTILSNRAGQSEKKSEETRTAVQDSESTDSKSSRKSNTKPVLITEVAKKDVDLPSIVEERTQEEMILRGGMVKREVQTKTVFTGEVNSKNNEQEQPTKPQQKGRKDTQVGNLEDVKTLIGEENQKESLKLPGIAGTGSQEAETENESRNVLSKDSKWHIPMRFVNQSIEQRMGNRDPDDFLPQYEDYESNDENLKFLEKRILDFHIRYGGKEKAEMKLPPLARFSSQNSGSEEEMKVPKPGGKVWVRKRLCQFSDERIQVKDHRHVRHHIVPEIPEFEQVTRTKQVMQSFLNVATNK